MSIEESKNIVLNWLKKNNIQHDNIIFSPEDKLKIYINNNIDIMIEDKVENLMKEIEKLQNENSDLRKDNERQRIEISALSAQKESYKEKYGEQKNKNDLLTGKVFEIENEFKNLRKNKDDEDYQCQKYKSDEYKKNKSENKSKIVSELQTKIQNYRNQRLRQRKKDN